MIIHDHRSIISMTRESLIYERVSGAVWAFLREAGFSLETLNYVLSECDANNDYFACFGFEFPDGMHACVSFIHNGFPTSQFVAATPGMTKAQALAEALRLAEEYLRDNPINDAPNETRML